jgi:hypothetical protein
MSIMNEDEVTGENEKIYEEEWWKIKYEGWILLSLNKIYSLKASTLFKRPNSWKMWLEILSLVMRVRRSNEYAYRIQEL